MAWKLLHVVTITYHRRWVAQVIRPGWPAATDTMAFMHRVSGWLGRLSVGRKLMLIYLLDLSAVIYVSSILIHEKYVAIDFTRKEIVGTTYAAVLRDGLMGQFLDASQQPPLAGDVIARLTGVRKAYDEQLRTQEVGERFSMVLGQLAAKPPAARDAQPAVARGPRAADHGRQPVQPDPGPRSRQLLRHVAGGAAVSRAAAGGARHGGVLERGAGRARSAVVL